MTIPKTIVAVTNDLSTDQRVDRTCHTLVKAGYEVLLVGRLLKESLPLFRRNYHTHRLRMIFHKGPLFYANYNIRLFFYLLFRRVNLIVSNDLDTLPACYLAFRLKQCLPLSLGRGGWGVRERRMLHLHDCHEFYRGVPELVNRPCTTGTWKWIEDRIFPHLVNITAVNDSIARLYREEYGREITVIRNVPFRKKETNPADRNKLGIKPGQKIILYQGALNVDRGLEEAIRAMRFIRADAVLLLIGTGDIHHRLISLAKDENVTDKVIFTGQIPFPGLHSYTLIADIGLSIEKDVGVNYHYCLPNKFLDYIQANVPVLVSPFPEMVSIVEKYGIGEFLESHDPERIAAQIDKMLQHDELTGKWKENLRMAAADLCWENEEARLIELISRM